MCIVYLMFSFCFPTDSQHEPVIDVCSNHKEQRMESICRGSKLWFSVSQPELSCCLKTAALSCHGKVHRV
jgi:hypothetical protein